MTVTPSFGDPTESVRVPDAWINDARLSWRARGLLVELLSYAPGEVITLRQLVDGGPEGRDAVRTALAELRNAGYLAQIGVEL